MSDAAGDRRRDAVVSLLLLGVLLIWDVSALDVVVAGWFGDRGGFRWRDAWLASRVLHDGGRVLSGLVLLVVVAGVVRPNAAGPSRAERSWWLGVLVICLLGVPALKQWSATSCPWDLERFGGVAALVSHWRPGAADGGPGRCFPSGHAVAAFAFISQHFLWRTRQSAVARRWLGGVCLAGVLAGGAQVVRGAHFPSHVLWSAWLCWTACSLAAACACRPARRGGPGVGLACDPARRGEPPVLRLR